MRATAVVLAGGERDDVCRADANAVNKAFVGVGGSPLVTRVLRGVREAENIVRVRVVAPENAPAGPLMLADERIASGPTISASLAAGFADLPPDEFVIAVAADLPVVSAAGIDDFLVRAQSGGRDIAYGFVERAAHERRYPTIRHTWVRLHDGVFCGSGVCAIRPRALPAVLQLLETVARRRRSPLRLAAMFGPMMLLRYVCGTLPVVALEKRAQELLGRPVQGICTPHPDLAVNIDRYSDLLRVEEILMP